MEIATEDIPLNKLKLLRKDIHQNPELSGEEEQTSQRIIQFLGQYNPSQIIKNIGGYGVAGIYNGKIKGPTIMIRCELDALPIQEANKFDHKSNHSNKSHKCGHDGHMAIVAGLAANLHIHPPNAGRVILLYQPAEETGEGAKKVINDPVFKTIEPDYIFALHNLPGFPLNHLVIKEGTFASSSLGMIIELMGRTSHAGEPEKGRSPLKGMSAIMQQLDSLPDGITENKDFILVTVIHALMGERAFGTTPGNAKVMATLRAYHDQDLELLKTKAKRITEKQALKYDLDYKITWTEHFSSTINNSTCVNYLKRAAALENIPVEKPMKPFRWSEDFGAFTQKFKGALFGLGAGLDSPQLHNPDYDFREELIPVGVRLFRQIISQTLNA